MVNLVNFVEFGWFSLKLTGPDKLVNCKVPQSEILIKIVEIMINIDLHVFSPVFTMFVYMHLPSNIYGTLTRP